MPATRHRRSAILLALVLLSALQACADEPATPDLKIGKLAVGKVLVLGNSITLHGPLASIGWEGNWGMAASAEEKDFVHLLVAKIAKQSGGQPKVMVKNIADFERNLSAYKVVDELKGELAFKPLLVVLAIGENVAALTTDEQKAAFAKAVSDLIATLKKQCDPTIFVRSNFWADAAKDTILKKAAEDAGAIFIDIGKLGSDEKNYARSERKIEHAGVAGHPGDRGMQAIADAIWSSIERQAASR